MENEIRHYVVIWYRVTDLYRPCFQRFDKSALADEFQVELLENAFVDRSFVQHMTEDQYRTFLDTMGLWTEGVN